jgi:hypothetical protein
MPPQVKRSIIMKQQPEPTTMQEPTGMQVVFSDNAISDIKRLVARERWYWKTWDFFRYDLPYGVKNLVFFFNVVWNYRGWQYNYPLAMLRRSLEPLHRCVLNGDEEDDPRQKKAEKIRRTIELLKLIETSGFIDAAKAELGYEIAHTGFLEDAPGRKEANKAARIKAREIEEAAWEELWYNLKGQDTADFGPQGDESFEEAENRWYAKFDGSGIRGWWD